MNLFVILSQKWFLEGGIPSKSSGSEKTSILTDRSSYVKNIGVIGGKYQISKA